MSDLYSTYKKITDKRREAAASNQEENQRRLKIEVEGIAKKRVQTVYIGAIARIEDNFGFLWGHNESSPSEEQLEFRRIWDKLRESILDLGNDQSKTLIRELEKYSWEKVNRVSVQSFIQVKE